MKKYNVQFTTIVTETYIVEAECDMEALDIASDSDDDAKPVKRRVERSSVVSAVEGFTAN